jgi:hypothetical protein
MATADFVTLANDVVDQLNQKQGGWAKSFTAERFYSPSPKLEKNRTGKMFGGDGRLPDCTRQPHRLGVSIRC